MGLGHVEWDTKELLFFESDKVSRNASLENPHHVTAVTSFLGLTHKCDLLTQASVSRWPALGRHSFPEVWEQKTTAQSTTSESLKGSTEWGCISASWKLTEHTFLCITTQSHNNFETLHGKGSLVHSCHPDGDRSQVSLGTHLTARRRQTGGATVSYSHDPWDMEAHVDLSSPTPSSGDSADSRKHAEVATGKPGTKAATDGPGCRAYAVYSHGQLRSFVLGPARRMGKKNPKWDLWGPVWGLELRLPFSILFGLRPAKPQQGLCPLTLLRWVHTDSKLQARKAVTATKGAEIPAAYSSPFLGQEQRKLPLDNFMKVEGTDFSLLGCQRPQRPRDA